VTEVRVRTVAECSNGTVAAPRYELAEWMSRFGVVAGITGSAGGFDLGLASADPMRAVMTRWRALEHSMAGAFSGVVVSVQRHGAIIGSHETRVNGLLIQEGLDGHVTAVPGTLLGVTVADCIPVYLLHPASGTMALLHAGWRGVACGILEHGVETVAEQGQADSADIIMHCGVGICGRCYEVGSEVIEAITGRQNGGLQRLDLRQVLHDRARALGLRKVSASSWCSAHDGDRFFSHRASGGDAGRMLVAKQCGRSRPAFLFR
jgi:copper oxidase (laccase) domain-containing protein